ncbi:MAG TPA: hypothetical protein VLY83_02985 [Methanoregula sp.]|nr:hypothetical protein [Methanoregula sp.]
MEPEPATCTANAPDLCPVIVVVVLSFLLSGLAVIGYRFLAAHRRKKQ